MTAPGMARPHDPVADLSAASLDERAMRALIGLAESLCQVTDEFGVLRCGLEVVVETLGAAGGGVWLTSAGVLTHALGHEAAYPDPVACERQVRAALESAAPLTETSPEGLWLA